MDEKFENRGEKRDKLFDLEIASDEYNVPWTAIKSRCFLNHQKLNRMPLLSLLTGAIEEPFVALE